MATPEKPEDPLKHVAIYKEDADETRRILGDSTSWARKYRAAIEIIKRERLVEKWRRQLLVGLEGVYLVSSEEEDAGKVPPIGGGGV
jgi:hypothetical protein